MKANLFALFQSRFPADRDKPFLIPRSGAPMSYGALDDLTARIATVLRATGAKPGDRIAVQVEKSAANIALYLAALRAGLVYLPLNSAYRDDEVDFFLNDAAPAIVVADPAQTAALNFKGARQSFTLAADGSGTLMAQAKDARPDTAIEESQSDDLAAILYSSGTTGKPKGVMLSHGNIAANATTLHKLWQFRPDDVLLHVLPIFHAHGLFVATNTTLLNGTPMIFHEKFVAADVVADLPRATVLMGVPTYYTRMLAEPALTKAQCARMRLFICGSAPLLPETFSQFTERTGHVILERYGMTEAGMIASSLPDRPRHAGIVGWPLPDVSLRLAPESNEIEIKGPNVFRGYWNKSARDEDFTADGYFRTGDIGAFEADGALAIVGRAKDLIISGGFNVYPKEIETLIDAMPGVDESAVVGMPHKDFGEAGLAVVTTTPGARLPTEDDIRSALKAQLANFKVPKMVVFAKSLPRNAVGKVQKNEIRKLYRAAWDAAMAKR